MPGGSGANVDAISYFLSHLSLLSWGYAICRAGPGASVVFHDLDNAYNSGCRYSPVDSGYAISSSAGRFRPSPSPGTMDLAALAVRLRNWRDRLLDALPDLPITIRKVMSDE